VLLSVLFVTFYGITNWFTAQRAHADVQTWHFAWELTTIPYVPLLIVPYMSMDLFFFVAAFLCSEERELRTFAKRVVFSILVAAAFFLLLPLKLAWPERPHVVGWLGDFVERSCTAPFLMEYPHNLFPSLHILLCVIVADIYIRHSRGIVRALLCAWFILIGMSTLLTWQHHLVDIMGGLMLAGFAFYFFREADWRRPVMPNVRVACYYIAGSVLVLILAKALGRWGVFLLWPAVGLGMTAGAYFGIGPGIFRKAEGRLPWSTRFVLAPILLGQYLSLVYYRRQCRPWDELTPGILVGGTLTKAQATEALQQGVMAVLDLTAEFSEAASFRATRYLNLPVLDLTAPTQHQLREAATFIAAQVTEGIVYVHCKIGYSRSAAAVGAYLLASGQAGTIAEAVELLRKARPSIVIRPEVKEALRAFANCDLMSVAA
jgi:protein-tyrosine phosphatase/membrane-associated phospholipid phosphatase